LPRTQLFYSHKNNLHSPMLKYTVHTIVTANLEFWTNHTAIQIAT